VERSILLGELRSDGQAGTGRRGAFENSLIILLLAQ